MLGTDCWVGAFSMIEPAVCFVAQTASVMDVTTKIPARAHVIFANVEIAREDASSPFLIFFIFILK